MRRKNWDKGQSTLEYFIIFAVIACVVIPLWSGSAFSKIQDSGKGFFAACTDRILKDSEPVGPPAGPAEVTLIGNYPNPFDSRTNLCFQIKDNSANITIKIRNDSDPRGGTLVDTIALGIQEPGCYNSSPGAHCPGDHNPIRWSVSSSLSSGNYWWFIEQTEEMVIYTVRNKLQVLK